MLLTTSHDRFRQHFGYKGENKSNLTISSLILYTQVKSDASNHFSQ